MNITDWLIVLQGQGSLCKDYLIDGKFSGGKFSILVTLERLLTEKLLTGKLPCLPTGKLFTDKVV
jgi:hypothetical protein